MKRRGFLAGILAAGMAPAIIHNPMKIFVPKQEIIVPKVGRGLRSPIYHIDEAAFWKPEVRRIHVGRTVQDEFGEAFFPTVIVQPLSKHINNLPVLARLGRDFDGDTRSLH